MAELPQGVDALARLAPLQEPLRRALYAYVVAQGGEVSRDQAAAALGLKRGLAAFHLDRLVAGGLLEAGYRRPPGRTGRGAGRPAKLYSRVTGEVEISLPPRRYELAARLLLEALEALPPGRARAATGAAARRWGGAIARSLPAERRRAAGAGTLMALLGELGFEPQSDPDGTVVLRNCPFRSLSQRHPNSVCSMNLELMRGLLAELGCRYGAELRPEAERCCVLVRPDRGALS